MNEPYRFTGAALALCGGFIFYATKGKHRGPGVAHRAPWQCHRVNLSRLGHLLDRARANAKEEPDSFLCE